MKKLFSKKTNILLTAVIAAAVVCVGALAAGGAFGAGGDASGERTFFSGMFRGIGTSSHGAGPGSTGGNTGPGAEADAPVTGPGAQNGVLGGSYGAKNGAPGAAGNSGGGANLSSDGSLSDASGNASGGAGGASGRGAGGGDTGVPEGPTVTLCIEAEKYKPGYIIMPARTVSFTEGETVFDVLYRECRASKIHMASRWTPGYNSYYIEGIDNLYEFDKGPLSGWVYSVNDWVPNYGSSSYKLEDGDVIAWRYALDVVRDSGG